MQVSIKSKLFDKYYIYSSSAISSSYHEKQRFGDLSEKKQEWRNQLNGDAH